MNTPTFETVVEHAQALSSADQERLLQLLEAWLGHSAATMTDEEFDQELLREGILDQVPPAHRDDRAFQEFKPIDIAGKPLSETIIEERR